MSLSLEQFAKSLSASGLMPPEEIKAFHASLPAEKRKDVQGFATELVRQGKLTKFQAAAIYQGNSKNLALGDYRVLDKIGAGGMGQVFKAEHKRMKRVVALKLLPPEVIKDAQAIKRFQREVETAAKLIHPNIVTAYDAGEHRGVHYLIMEYVDGQDLSGLVKKQGTLPVETAVNFIVQAARGLEHAHGEGVVHRDIKPANLLVDKKGTVKILDMGLARVDATLSSKEHAESLEGLTSSGVMMGTVDYMSPEQAVDTRQVDHRADIYSLGCTLFYLLIGRRMYEGDTLMRRVLAHRDAPIPSLTSLRPDVPEAVDAVVRRMVAKRTEDRYATMAEARQALEHCLSKMESSGDSSVFLVEKVVDEDLASFLKGMQAQAVAVAPATRVATETLVNKTDQDTRPDSKSHGSLVLAASRNRMYIAAGIGVGIVAAVIVAGVLWMNRSRGVAPNKASVAQAKIIPGETNRDAATGEDSKPDAANENLPAFPRLPTPEPEKPAETTPATAPSPVEATPAPQEPASATTPAAPKTIVVGVDAAKGETPDLYKAFELAKAGDTILIRHRGPLEMPPLEMAGKAPLTIVGDGQEEAEFWPLLVQGPPPVKDGMDPNAPAAAAAAMFHGERVEITLKKLHLAIGGPGPRRGKLGALFALAQGRIRIEACSITVGSADQPGEPLGEPMPLVRTTSGPDDAVELTLRQTYFRGGRLAGCVTSTGGGRVVLDAQQSLWAAGVGPLVSAHDVAGPLHVGLDHCTLYNVPSLLQWESASGTTKSFGDASIRLTLSRNVIVGPYLNKEPLLAWSPSDSQADLNKAVTDGLVAWQGEGNVYHRFSGYYREPRSKSLASLTRWRALWGQSGAGVDRESDPHFRVWPTDYLLQEADAWDYEPRFWRNREKSRQIAEGEVGAAVGGLPAALPRSFDRQPIPPELASKPRGTPRVLRVHQRDGPYKTIEAALADVRDGDIVEIADNGPYTPRRNFTVSPGDGVLTAPVDCLTIRAGKEASPLVLLREEAQEGSTTNAQWLGGWLMFLAAQNRTSVQIDGLHFRLLPSPTQTARTVLAVNNVGLLRTSNCSFSMLLATPAQYIVGMPPVLWLENNAYLSGLAKNDVEMVRLDFSPHSDRPIMQCAVRNCLFNGHALAHRTGNLGNRKKINLVLQANTFRGRVAEVFNGANLASSCTDNLVAIFSPEAAFKFDDDSVWRTAVKQGDRNALWIGARTLTSAERSESVNALLPGPVLKTPPTFEATTAARDPLRPFHVRRAPLTAADGGPVGVRFEYLPDMPPEG